MIDPHRFEDVLDKVAEGVPVDWDAVEQRARSPEESALLRNLRVLAQLADTHRAQGLVAATRDMRRLEDDVPVADPDRRAYWGRYRLIRTIGQGSFGTVYLARDEQLDREVALKLLHPHVVAHDDIKAEGRALARVDHPNVLTVYGVEEHEGRLALCMKYIRGRTLDDIVRTDGPMNAEEAVIVAKAVCNALAAVHAAGVLHRDVKARNVMRERNGRYVLMDFGAGVVHAGDDEATGAPTVGTPLYMAPELILGGAASRKSDIYAVGVLLYYLVTGEYPVTGASVDELKAAHRTGRRARLSDRLDLPPGFVRAIDSALAAEPDARPESVAVLLRDLLIDETAAPPSARTVAQQVASALLGLLAAAIGVTLLGFINSTQFNLMFERRAVAAESIVDWTIWGVRSLVGPLFNLVQVVVEVLIVVILFRVVRRLWPAANRGWNRLAAAARRGRHVAGLDEPEALAQLVVLAGTAYLALVILWHTDLLLAFLTPLSALSAGQRALLAPGDAASFFVNPSHVAYRNLLDYVVIGTGWALLYLLRTRRQGLQKLNPVYIVAVGSVFIIATVLWNAPYRVMFQAQRPRVVFDHQRCYDLGTADAEMLVYCPDGAPPKVRRVAVADERLESTDITESVFVAR